MHQETITIISETINRLIILSQSEQRYALYAGDSLLQKIALSKVEAYNNAIKILQSTLLQENT